DQRARQGERLTPFSDTVLWLDALAEAFSGCVIANEVLDAMPAVLFQWNAAGEPMELGVRARPDAEPPFVWDERPAGPDLAAALAERIQPLPGCRAEIDLQAEAWVRQIGGWLKAVTALLIDYGFPRREYDDPHRPTGTLMSHFRHHSFNQALCLA